MGQEEVYNFLETNKGWWSTRELAEHIDIQQSTISLNLSKLVKLGLVIREKTKKYKNGLYYEYILSEYGNKQRKKKNAMSVSQLNMRKLQE